MKTEDFVGCGALEKSDCEEDDLIAFNSVEMTSNFLVSRLRISSSLLIF